jgi:nucleoside phosphorylase
VPFPIEILSIGGDFYAEIDHVIPSLNFGQKEFQFLAASQNHREIGQRYVQHTYKTPQIWELLENYRRAAKGYRPFLIAIVNRPLDSPRYRNLFGSHRAENGLAVITLHDHKLYVESYRPFLCYYLIRYALSFVCPDLKSHKETRGCFFDFKERKTDLKESLDSGNFCDKCRGALWEKFNQEINVAIQQMIRAMKAAREHSTDEIQAEALKGQVDVGIITIRPDEFEAMLDRFPSRRSVKGSFREYHFSRVQTGAKEELGVVVARSPDQGTGPVQALANNMIADLNPWWIFVVGIAGGFPDTDFTLGDVLLSKRVHDFSVSAALEGKSSQFQDMGGPVHLDVENLIINLAARKAALGQWSDPENLGLTRPTEDLPDSSADKAFYGSDETRAATFKALMKHFGEGVAPRNPRYFDAPVISGNTLLKDTELATQWRQNARHAAGVEMEVAGACVAARYGGGVRVLAIRGISDIVGYVRRPVWTEFACQSAAAFAFTLIKSGIIRHGR